VQGYEETRTTHYCYDKVLPDGSTSGTMVSFGRDSETVPPQMWSMVWRRQLRLRSEQVFWRGLDGEEVEYDIPPTPVPSVPLPEHLERLLRDTLHYSEDQIGAIPLRQAQDMLNAHYSRELRLDRE